MENSKSEVDSLVDHMVSNYGVNSNTAKNKIVKSRCKEFGILWGYSYLVRDSEFLSMLKNSKCQKDKIGKCLIDNCKCLISGTSITGDLPHTTRLWIVTGDKREVIANTIFAKIIAMDVFRNVKSLSIVHPYIIKNYTDLLKYKIVDDLSKLNEIWAVYIRNWDSNNNDAVSSMVYNRKDCSGIVKPTIITVRDGIKTSFDSVIELGVCSDDIKVIKT